MKKIPTLSSALIKQLIQDEPDIDITPILSMEEIQFRAGRWSILNELNQRQEYEDNQEPFKTEIKLNVSK